MTPPPEYEEWRLAFELPDSGHTPQAFIDRIRGQVNPDVAIHRRGRNGIALYAKRRPLIERAEEIVRARLDAWRLDAVLEPSRWNPGGERWQEPSLPIQLPPAPLSDPWADLDEMAWEVRLRFESDRDARRLADELRHGGAAVLEGWKRCLVAMPDEATARERAEELRQAAPRAEIEVRPLSRFRRWQIRQRVYGNYA